MEFTDYCLGCEYRQGIYCTLFEGLIRDTTDTDEQFYCSVKEDLCASTQNPAQWIN